jgi:predicted DNA-binding transcriptional regulator YafY
MAEHLDLTKRSIHRLLDSLNELGYPLYPDPERDHRYFLVDPGSARKWWMPLPSIDFSLEDRVLLDWVFEHAGRQPALADTVRHLRKNLSFVGAATGYALEPKEGGAGEFSHRPRLLTSMMIPKLSGESQKALVKAILAAIDARKICEVSYASRESNEVKTYPVHPLCMFEAEGGLYVFVETHRHGSIRILALERIRELRMLEDLFVWPEGFNPKPILEDPFGMIQQESVSVVLRFDEDQAPYVRERAWPASYVFEDQADGSLLMRLETGGIYGLKRWLLGWGRSAEVLEPAWLRDEMRDELVEALKKYEVRE